MLKISIYIYSRKRVFRIFFFLENQKGSFNLSKLPTSKALISFSAHCRWKVKLMRNCWAGFQRLPALPIQFLAFPLSSQLQEMQRDRTLSLFAARPFSLNRHFQVDTQGAHFGFSNGKTKVFDKTEIYLWKITWKGPFLWKLLNQLEGQ